MAHVAFSCNVWISASTLQGLYSAQSLSYFLNGLYYMKYQIHKGDRAWNYAAAARSNSDQVQSLSGTIHSLYTCFICFDSFYACYEVVALCEALQQSK